jgi:transposase-like protein
MIVRQLRPPCTGDKWGCDEKYQKVRGKESYIMAIMDLATRFVLAWDISPTKEKYDAAPLLRKARDAAGRIPHLFIIDGLERYHIAFKKVFRTLKGPISFHICDIIRNLICNTNKERLNEGFADRFKCAHGINKESDIPHGHTPP